MSPASRSKLKDKTVSKETSKSSLKSSGPTNSGSSIPASAYNPMSGTFHTFESLPTSTGSPLHNNGRFRIDETDEHLGSTLGGGVEYDSISNNGSWSGESEDHKDKTYNPHVRQETVPGADNDKREKIRQKNEKKHQRQKERRAQELHEKCSGYLMSRKLESLAQKLVAMGFSHERATMALILNEGKVEQSVAWLFEGGEDVDRHKDSNLNEGNLKIDISEELAQIADMEIMYNCTKQEVERAVVVAEGNLEKAAEALREMKQEPASAAPKPDEIGDPPTGNNGKLSVTASRSSEVRSQLKCNTPPTIQQLREEKDFNYTKTAVTVGGFSPSGRKNGPLKKIEPKLEWAKPEKVVVPAEKRWPTAGSKSCVSYSLAPPLEASPPPAKPEARYIAVGNEIMSLKSTPREPVIVMQRPQSVITKQVPATGVSSSPPRTAASWYPKSNVEVVKSNGFMTHMPSTILSTNYINSNQMQHQLHYQQQHHLIPNTSPTESPGNIHGNASWSRGAAPTIAAASSLGLFSGLGSNASSGAASPVDWSTAGSLSRFDYTNIDWRLDRGLSSPRPNEFWPRPTSYVENSLAYDSKSKPTTSSASVNGNNVAANGDSLASGSSPVWTSPFGGTDLFSLPQTWQCSSYRTQCSSLPLNPDQSHIQGRH